MKTSTLATDKIKDMDTITLCNSFDLTETMHGEEIPIVRGWIMDELESRDAAKFDTWMEDYEASPSKYFF